MAADLMIAQTQAQLSFIGRRIRQLHEQHDAQIATLASRIAGLESSITEANVVDKGVWREGIAYRKGEAGHVQRIAVDCANRHHPATRRVTLLEASCESR